MAEYLIELAQLSKLLSPSLDNKQFLDLAIQHFPPDVRSALIVARPSSFVEAVVLLKQLQGRKVAERSSDLSSGQLNTSRRNNLRQNNFQPSGAGADHQRPTQSAQIGPENSEDSPQEGRSHPMQESEWTGRGNQQRGNHWTSRGSGPRFGHDGGPQNRPDTFHHQGGSVRNHNGYRNNQQNGNSMNRGPRVNFFRSNRPYFQNDRQRPYWIQRNISNGYYRFRNRRNSPRGNRRNDRGRENGDNVQNDAPGGLPGPNQNRADENTRQHVVGTGGPAAITSQPTRNHQNPENDSGM